MASKKRTKKPSFDKFMEFWNSETTKNLFTIWAPFLGYLTLVPMAYKIEQHLRDEKGRPQIAGFGGNFTVLYSGATVAKLAANVVNALGISPTELAKILKK